MFRFIAMTSLHRLFHRHIHMSAEHYCYANVLLVSHENVFIASPGHIYIQFLLSFWVDGSINGTGLHRESGDPRTDKSRPLLVRAVVVSLILRTNYNEKCFSLGIRLRLCGGSTRIAREDSRIMQCHIIRWCFQWRLLSALTVCVCVSFGVNVGIN